MSTTLTEGVTTPESAAAALAAAVAADQGREAPGVPGPGAAPGTADAQPPANQPTPPADTPSEDDAGAAEEPQAPESLIRSADIDLSGLTPDAKAWLEAREREMQGIMTQRTQEAAEIRKQFEDLGDPAEAREALAFYQGIRTDPNYAAQVYDFLTTNLMAAGYTPAQAAAAALNQMEEPAVQEPAAPLGLPEGGDDVDEALARRLAEIDQRTQQLDARFNEAEQREMQARMVNEILRQDNAIRQAHPDYTDEHLDMIYALAESTQGNLFAAEKMFSEFREAEIQRYISSKETADDPAPPATPPAQLIEAPRTLDQAHAAALERLRTELAASG